jgi:UDP-N-acetylmuramate: L-alanyl-gamma-D-glutamyl-meso-diaminopimelate ligase
LEKLTQQGDRILFRDFAHAPSKVEATTEAVKHQYPGHKLLAAVELHTFSSLNRAFLDQYKDSLDAADEAVVYFNAHTLAVKRLEPITTDDIIDAFDRPNLRVFTNTAELQAYLLSQRNAANIFLLMSSGSFGGLDLDVLAEKLIAGV